MTYNETCNYLYNCTPLFSKIGAGAYKPGLDTTMALDKYFGHPHRNYRTIHVAGTNGKGSTSHTLSAILQLAGYKVGLFTSPHLVDFRERIRVNGEMIGEGYVVDFVERYRDFFEPLHPSFFELTTAMALKYFSDQQVDIAVIEVGLGGRLDCTNIITPIVSVITSISIDHTDLLGDSLQAIAGEKAGIIKHGVPVVVGEGCREVMSVFEQVAAQKSAPLIRAEAYPHPIPALSLSGEWQQANARIVLCTLEKIRPYYSIDGTHIQEGLDRVCEITGLRGRWETLQVKPLTLCDVGHNEGAWQYLGPRLQALAEEHRLHVVFGMCNDKDMDTVLTYLPSSASYYWTQADTHRAISSTELFSKASSLNLQGKAYPSVVAAYHAAQEAANASDAIFIGGSCYVVADLLQHINNQK